MDKSPDSMTIEELRAELERLKDSLCDFEDMHSFTFQKTTVHIGAEMAQNMQAEFEEECREVPGTDRGDRKSSESERGSLIEGRH